MVRQYSSISHDVNLTFHVCDSLIIGFNKTGIFQFNLYSIFIQKRHYASSLKNYGSYDMEHGLNP